jgi:hypothetical protein
MKWANHPERPAGESKLVILSTACPELVEGNESEESKDASVPQDLISSEGGEHRRLSREILLCIGKISRFAIRLIRVPLLRLMAPCLPAGRTRDVRGRVRLNSCATAKAKAARGRIVAKLLPRNDKR